MARAAEQRGEVEVGQLAREGEKHGDGEVPAGFNVDQMTDADASELRKPLLRQAGRVPRGAYGKSDVRIDRRHEQRSSEQEHVRDGSGSA